MNLLPASQANELSDQIRESGTNEAFFVILTTLGKRISKAVRNRHKSVVFSVPAMVFGFPKYDLRDAIQFVESVVEGKGYEVESHACGVMAVTWTSRAEQSETRDKYDIKL